MIERICFVTSDIFYNTFRHFTEGLAAAFERQGVETLTVDLKDPTLSLEEILYKIFIWQPTLTCSFNLVCVVEPHLFVFDKVKIPHWTITLDPAFYFTHLIRSPYALFSSADRYECAILRNMNPRTFFFPHAINREWLDIKKNNDPRCYDAVFVGSCHDYEGLRRQWHLEFPSPLPEIADRAVEIFFQGEQVSVVEAFSQAWSERAVEASNCDLKAAPPMRTLLSYLDNHVRGRSRVEMIRSFDKVQIHVFGSVYPTHPDCVQGWEHYLSGRDNVIIHPPLPFLQTLDLFRQSKFCLNNMPSSTDGSHERVLMALACGSLPVTTPSGWLAEQFNVGEELLFANSSGGVEEQMLSLLADENERLQRAMQGYAKVAEHHTWDHRVVDAQRAIEAIFTK